MENANPTSSPLLAVLNLSEKWGNFWDPELYKRLVGKLLCLNFIRPDIAFATQKLS